MPRPLPKALDLYESNIGVEIAKAMAKALFFQLNIDSLKEGYKLDIEYCNFLYRIDPASPIDGSGGCFALHYAAANGSNWHEGPSTLSKVLPTMPSIHVGWVQ